ncbi:muscle M-line assembly protein unc-89-like isoform X1 [Diprion similis]|uniref:muscle M-line assembly protein unc-89-like isoform X1 n=1 Tax=Diprion similis TaxID=362088 RepID=UPI001EF8E509|nr:muscle M-line assembly protein unc-89-like isoform X1 [Diprion similis]
MRLWFSIPILLILACIILESAAVKTKRDSGDASKYRHKSSNPTEDHYSMNKLDHKKKSRIEKREVLKKKGQHRNGEANEKIDAGKFLKEESKERNGKMYYEEKSGKMSQNKISKSKENVKNDKHTDKVAKAKSKKSKRSTELEAPNETLDNAAGYLAGFKKNAHSNFDPASKREKSKDKVTKKSGCGIGKSVDSKLKEEFSVNSEPVSDIQSPKETTSALDCNDKRGESKEFKKQKMNSEKIKKQKHNNNSNDLHKGNINLKESESPEEKNHEITKPVQPDGKKIKYRNDLPENSYYLNEDGLIKKKTAKNENAKQKISEKISEDELECKPRINDCKLNVPDTPIYETDMPDKYKSGTCNLEDDHATEQSKTCYRPKESKCHANDVVKNSVAGTKQEDMEQMSAQENKARDNNAEEKNSNGEESISENVVQDGSDTV